MDAVVGFFYDKVKQIGTEFTPGSSRQKALQRSASMFLSSAQEAQRSDTAKEVS
jgi:hydrogenase small subunit